MARWELFVSLLIPVFILIHIYVAPYTKVEESFNIQAIHDILTHGVPTENAAQFFAANYDHVSFPGSVPRTFVGALALSGLTRPFLGPHMSTAQTQLLVRALLGLCNGIALVSFSFAVQKVYGRNAGVWFALLQASQFHVIYYASRTLPNMYAFILSTVALGSLLGASKTSPSSKATTKGYRLCLYLLTLSGVVFRSELAILVGTVTLYLLAKQQISVIGVAIPAGIGGLVIGLLCTIPIDSYFWQSFPLWPEWTAFYYNTIQGNSAAWGVSPWNFYFTNALPRLLMNPFAFAVCIPLALWHPATRYQSLDLLVPSLSFVGLYSLLPHKEWRFIIYVIPALTGVAAAGASWIWTRRAKSLVYAVLSLALVGSISVSFVASTALLVVSSLNYPGGTALDYLHNHVYHATERHYHVYFDNLACQTGVTRFLENHNGPQTIDDILEAQNLIGQRAWTYDKTEDPEQLLDPAFWRKFDYVLAERPEKVIGAWDVLHVVYGFGGIRIVKPGEKSGASLESVDIAGHKEVYAHGSTSKIAGAWKTLEGLARDRLLKGWWVEVRMEPKIRILVNQEKNRGNV